MKKSAGRIRAELAGSLSAFYMDPIVDALAPLWALTEPVSIDIDMSGISWVSPTPFVLIKATLRFLQDGELLGQECRLIPPENPEVFAYMRRMDLFQGLEVDGLPPEGFSRHSPIGFRECQDFAAQEDVRVVSVEILKAMSEAHRYAGFEVDTSGFRVCFDEIMDNVIFHAGEGIVGFSMAQVTPRNGWFEIAVADLGMGIRQSLGEQVDLAGQSDADAIKTAMELGVTSKPATNAGYGLALGTEFVRLNGGHLIVRSGHATVRVGSNPQLATSSSALRGTLVTFRTRIDGPCDVQAAYNSLFPKGVDEP